MLEGFCNWKKARERFERHERSECHREALVKLQGMQNPSVMEQLSSEVSREQAERRSMLLTQLRSLKFLLRQGLSIRGHKENEGNLMQLLKMQSEDSPSLQKWLGDNHYMSHGVVNEMITIMGNTLLRDILSSIRAAKWFSVMADETRDISNDEQMTVVIRWVDLNYTVHEDFIGMIHVPDTTSATLTTVIKDVLICCILPLDLCRGQAYDGASNMMGHLTGVAAQIQHEYPAALKVHCLAHCLNLCLQEAAKKCTPIRAALHNMMELLQLIKYSPKRSRVFQEFKQELSIGGPGLRPLCPTRWTVRTAAIDAVLKNYPVLLQSLQHVSETCYDDYGRRANGLHAQLEKFDTYFGLKLSYLLFSGTEQTSTNLQGKNTSIQEALSYAELTTSYLRRLRGDEAFKEFYETVVKESEEYTEEPILPRYKRPPRRLDAASAPHRFSSPECYYRFLYFQALDLISEQIISRFKQESMLVPQNIENLLIEAANNQDTSPIDIPSSIINMYSRDVNFERAKVQLQMLPDLVKSYKQSQGLSKLEISSMRTITDLLNNVPLAKDMFSEVDNLLRIYFTMPITTCTAERSFSCLRRVKNYLRSTMSDERLNNVILLHAHKELTDHLDLRDIASTFISANERRASFLVIFNKKCTRCCTCVHLSMYIKKNYLPPQNKIASTAYAICLFLKIHRIFIYLVI